MKKRTLPQVLVVDDDPAHRLMLRTMLEGWSYEVTEADGGARAVELLREGPFDLVLMDVRMPDMNGIEATRAIHAYNPAVPVLIVTAYSSVASAVEALKSGAYAYPTKPLDFDTLKLTLERALEHRDLKRENEDLRSQLTRLQVPDLVGRSPAMRRLLEMIALVAPSEATVLVTGESGTGKGLAARAIHANSSRRSKPLVEVNCAAIPENLMESELFGHEKGAFTGADRARQGRFSQADGGTVFLDEIGELPPLMQAKLLRVLQEGDLQRVGSDRPVAVDARVLAASNRDLEAMVEAGGFREDLYYRLNVVRLEVPPLRERVEDIPLLAEHFRERLAAKNRKTVKGLTPQAMDRLLKHPWPGNVRELENVLERAVILLQGEYISERELPLSLQGPAEEEEASPAVPAEPFPDSGQTLAEMERRTILRVLEETGGNKSEAARRLGVTRRTLQLKLKKYEEKE